MEAAVAWLARSQDCSASRDGGSAMHFSLISGWSESYPETTGYIVPTLLEYARLRGDDSLRRRARRMLDWLIDIQFPDGGFQGGGAHAEPRVPVAFNTGQVLFGLAAGAREFGDDRTVRAMAKAAGWLTSIQDPDGAWRRFASPFSTPGEKTYDAHSAAGLIQAARLEPGQPWGAAAVRHVRWVLTLQRPNGWFERCAHGDPAQPSTHSLGYAFRGVIEAYRLSGDRTFLDAARRTADGLLAVLGADGRLPGRLRSDWTPAVDWTCPTGTAQVSDAWLALYEDTGESRYRAAALLANSHNRRVVRVDAPPDLRGAVPGSFPVDGEFRPYQYLNWAAKFFVDANLAEGRVLREGTERRGA